MGMDQKDLVERSEHKELMEPMDTQEREDDLVRPDFQDQEEHEDPQDLQDQPQTPSAANTSLACCHLFERNSQKNVQAAMRNSQWDTSNSSTTDQSKMRTPTPKPPLQCSTSSMCSTSKPRARRNPMAANTSLPSPARTFNCATHNPRTVITGWIPTVEPNWTRSKYTATSARTQWRHV